MIDAAMAEMLKKQLADAVASSMGEVSSSISADVAGDVKDQAKQGLFDSIGNIQLGNKITPHQLEPIQHMVSSSVPRVQMTPYQATQLSPYEKMDPYRGLMNLLGVA